MERFSAKRLVEMLPVGITQRPIMRRDRWFGKSDLRRERAKSKIRDTVFK